MQFLLQSPRWSELVRAAGASVSLVSIFLENNKNTTPLHLDNVGGTTNNGLVKFPFFTNDIYLNYKFKRKIALCKSCIHRVRARNARTSSQLGPSDVVFFIPLIFLMCIE